MIDDACRYYTNIVGKYGPQVVALRNKAAYIVGLDNIKYLCPLYGPVWRKDLGYIIDKYPLWDMKAVNLQKRTMAIMGNGSWAPRSGALMKEEIESLKNMTILEEEMTVTSSLKAGNESEIDALASAIGASVLG